MNKPSPALCVATLALAVAVTGTAGAAGLIDGHSIRDHSIPASKLVAKSITDRQVKNHALTKLALDPNAVTIVNNVNAPAGPQGDPGIPGPAVPGAPGKDGTAKAFAYINSLGAVSNDSGNVSVTHPATGAWCVTAPGAIAVVSLANYLSGGGNVYVSNPSHGFCQTATGPVFEVLTVNGSNAAADLAFNIITA